MRILLATDAFPPRCGGSGWSTYELARGLRARGHEVHVLQPRPNGSVLTREYDGFTVREFPFRAPDIPYVRNYAKNERLRRRLAPELAALVRSQRIDVIHAQHVLTCPPAIDAARATNTPIVCTVRDYWPVCYWSDLIHDPDADHLCPGCSPAMMVRCIRPRAGAARPLALPLIPYMWGNLRRKREALADADAVVAVSGAIARDLRGRAPELASTRVEVIPNPVDLEAIDAAVAGTSSPIEGPYAVYAGKLAPNKGVAKLLPAIERANVRWPLIVVGEGPEQARLEAEWRRAGRSVRFTGWLPRAEALTWIRHASLLVFPSHGPESLSRVLLEASALGVAIAAMDTGGTRDIIHDEVTGLLSTSVAELGDDVARLAADEALRRRLGAAARDAVARTFAASVVVSRIEALYRDLTRDASLEAGPAEAERG